MGGFVWVGGCGWVWVGVGVYMCTCENWLYSADSRSSSHQVYASIIVAIIHMYMVPREGPEMRKSVTHL